MSHKICKKCSAEIRVIIPDHTKSAKEKNETRFFVPDAGILVGIDDYYHRKCVNIPPVVDIGAQKLNQVCAQIKVACQNKEDQVVRELVKEYGALNPRYQVSTQPIPWALSMTYNGLNCMDFIILNKDLKLLRLVEKFQVFPTLLESKVLKPEQKAAVEWYNSKKKEIIPPPVKLLPIKDVKEKPKLTKICKKCSLEIRVLPEHATEKDRTNTRFFVPDAGILIEKKLFSSKMC